MGEDFLRNEERVVMRYNSVLDLHTHTLVSGHAYCSLREMAKAASKKGLEVLGITEHAPADVYKRQIIDRAKEYINENFRRDISLDDVSREVDISPYYFSKLFKQETGKNFIEYLTEIRLKNARELLQDSRLSIKEICAQSGYSDPNYFSRIFKKYEGVTPSEFRERLG